MTQALSHSVLRSDVAVGSWTLDPARTTVRISHKTMWGLVTVKGVFSEVAGRGTISPAHEVSGTVEVGAASVDTSNTRRDKHLRSAEFFDVEVHPTFVITVRSAAEAGEQLELSGDLTIKGITEPITLTADITDLDASTLTAHVTGSVDRERFGLSFNQLGMIRGRTGLDIHAVLTRTT